ncbi:hypothetical protein Dalk_4345 [Desulfatibacillum aliphaticivorans]|uniref:Uncharacterized protein n=1 Tax=Desulfatibacillum aliphaticivorans TaxID=218208 RepID=B8FN55_DESAL|nr:hypothetical protein [Desulfatibacillum aliphaticivorans]ACL06024.1 hypothetical protein Dalk_4345 [Desulfatibacillum aliphaticivorans]
MSNEEKDNDVKKANPDPDMGGVEAALIRAGKLARKRARQAGMGVIVMRDGKIVEDFSKGKE